MSNFTKLHLTHTSSLPVFSQFLWNLTFIFSDYYEKFSLVFVFVFIYLPHDYNNYKDMPKKKCRKKWRGGLKETIELMLIRPPQLQFSKMA